MSLTEVHIYIQSFRVDATLDLAAGEIRTKHFVIRQGKKGDWEVLEKKVELTFLKHRVVATELAKK